MGFLFRNAAPSVTGPRKPSVQAFTFPTASERDSAMKRIINRRWTWGARNLVLSALLLIPMLAFGANRTFVIEGHEWINHFDVNQQVVTTCWPNRPDICYVAEASTRDMIPYGGGVLLLDTPFQFRWCADPSTPSTCSSTVYTPADLGLSQSTVVADLPVYANQMQCKWTSLKGLNCASAMELRSTPIGSLHFGVFSGRPTQGMQVMNAALTTICDPTTAGNSCRAVQGLDVIKGKEVAKGAGLMNLTDDRYSMVGQQTWWQSSCYPYTETTIYVGFSCTQQSAYIPPGLLPYLVQIVAPSGASYHGLMWDAQPGVNMSQFMNDLPDMENTWSSVRERAMANAGLTPIEPLSSDPEKTAQQWVDRWCTSGNCNYPAPSAQDSCTAYALHWSPGRLGYGVFTLEGDGRGFCAAYQNDGNYIVGADTFRSGEICITNCTGSWGNFRDLNTPIGGPELEWVNGVASQWIDQYGMRVGLEIPKDCKLTKPYCEKQFADSAAFCKMRTTDLEVYAPGAGALIAGTATFFAVRAYTGSNVISLKTAIVVGGSTGTAIYGFAQEYSKVCDLLNINRKQNCMKGC